MTTVKQKAKIKITCQTCDKMLVSWWFDEEDGKFADNCKYCQTSDEVYKCQFCQESKPFNEMMVNRGNVQKGCKECDCKKSKKRYLKNRKSRIQTVKRYVQNNTKKVRDYHKQYMSQPHQKIRLAVHRRMKDALKANNTKKTVNTIPLLGCSLEMFLDWMKFQFTPGMNIHNHGEWHMDHCKPCASYDLKKVSEQKKCFHWTNIQPLWGPDNLSKSNNYTHWDLFQQEIKVAAFKFKYFGTLSPGEELYEDSQPSYKSLSVPLTDGKPSVIPPGKLGKITYEIIIDDLFGGPDILATYKDGKPIRYSSRPNVATTSYVRAW